MYGIGAVLYAMTTRSRRLEQPIWLGDGRLDQTLHPQHLDIPDDGNDDEFEDENDSGADNEEGEQRSEEDEGAGEQRGVEGGREDDERQDDDDDEEDPYENEPPPNPRDTDPGGAQTTPYSRRLRRLINDCLTFDPTERPAIENLLQRIRDATGDDANDSDRMDQSGGMRNNIADQATADAWRLELPQDHYRVGLALDELP